MTQRVKLWLYIGLLHASLVVLIVWRGDVLNWWLVPAEILLVVSLWYGIRLVRATYEPIAATLKLRDIVESHELGSRYALTGHAEVDSILTAYNQMLAGLQKEWLRLGEHSGFLDRFLQVTPVGVLILDFEERVSLVNRRCCEFLGAQSDAQLVGLGLAAIDAPLAQWLRQLKNNEPRMVTDASGRRLLCRRAEFQDRGFARPYILIEELTAEIDRRERESYERFVRVVAHEVTNTVAATNSLLQSCLQYSAQIGDADREDYDTALNVIITRNRNLNEFTNRFSELVRLPEPNPQQVDIAALLHEMRTMFRADAEQRHVALEVRVEDGLPTVAMDRNQMDRVMINVIRNAMEALPREGEGRIELTASRDAELVEVSVVDNGVGLGIEPAESLFMPFYTTKSHGQGLGLSLVKEILTRHGFRFSLDSREGSTRFRIMMPATHRTA
jgi:nitrogen fixation/metabolism regulation signal transduction histidine kinase